VIVIGVDSGGTFTDVVVMTEDRSVAVGKARSTPNRPVDGVVAGIVEAASALGTTADDLLARTDVLAHGTTVGLNALLTRTGARVGLVTTKGFEDTLAIARINRVVGIDDRTATDPIAWSKPATVVPRSSVVGVRERVDRGGTAVVPLDEQSAIDAIRELAQQSVEAIAVSLLWSFKNPAHEIRIRELAATHLPGVPVTLSSELAPRIGEYERTITSVINAYVAPTMTRYLADLDSELAARGFRGELLVMQSSGGVQSVRELGDRPLASLRSGPVAGIAATTSVGARLGHANVIASDVGGTSFDVGIVVDGRPQVAARPMIDRWVIATPVVDIESIGTGGGSIAWIDESSGALKVGPESAGADPGPACYGRGGSSPTLTDAAVVLGWITHFAGGVAFDREAARRAVDRVAEPLGMTATDAAAAIVEVSCAHMADLVRRVTVRRGHDPADFVLYAYGGAAPQYVGLYAGDVGVSGVVVPVLAPVFSAYGAAASDVRTSADMETPMAFPPAPAWLNEMFDTLEGRARRSIEHASGTGSVGMSRTLHLKFAQQVHRLPVDVPAGRIDEPVVDHVRVAFQQAYERAYGAGTAVDDATIELVGLRVDAWVERAKSLPRRNVVPQTQPEFREAWFGEPCRVPVYAAAGLPADTPVEGPAFIEFPATTIVVHPHHRATIDDAGNVFVDVFSKE
jgi:N-methylhydantoinase A